MDLTLALSLASVAIIILVGFPVHEFSHAFAAYRLGDSTARWQGRLSLNPLVHFDPIGGLMLVLSSLAGFFVGWAKPTPVNPYNLRYGRRGEALVAVAGPVSNLIMAAAVAIPVRLIWAMPSMADTVFATPIGTGLYDIAFFFVLINSFLFLFNLLPIPPLDGWKVLLGLVDARTSFRLRQFEQYGFFLLLFIVFFGGRFIAPLGEAVFRVLIGDASLVAP